MQRVTDDDRKRLSIRSGARWEPLVAYSRAIRAGSFIIDPRMLVEIEADAIVS